MSTERIEFNLCIIGVLLVETCQQYVTKQTNVSNNNKFTYVNQMKSKVKRNSSLAKRETSNSASVE